MPRSAKYDRIVTNILEAPDLKSYVRNNFTGETLVRALRADHEKYHLYTTHNCARIGAKHGEEIEGFIPRAFVISAIQNSGEYERDFVLVCQVHDAIYETMYLIREVYEDLINAHPQTPLTELIAEDTPEHLQDTDNFNPGETLKNYVARSYYGRDIYRAAIIYRRPVTPAPARALYEQYSTEITQTLSAVPPEAQTPWSDSVTDKVNLALMQTALALYKEHKNIIVKNPGETIAHAQRVKARKLKLGAPSNL